MARVISSQVTRLAFILAGHAAIAIGGEVCRVDSCRTNGSAFVQISPPSIGHVPFQPDALNSVHDPSLSQVDASATITVVSYNLYWWNVRQNNRWSSLYQRIRDARSFDLIGFQECEDVASVLRSTGLTSFDYYQGPKPNPAPLAWNRDVFQRIAGPGNKFIASDRWGNRHLTWVRLRHNSGATVFFANTHGPLGNCGTTVGNNWLGGVNENKGSGDTVFVTGDFNCGTGSPAMNILKGQLTVDFDGGIDQILSDKGRKVGGGSGKRDGSPSDHPLIKGAFTVTGGGGNANPRRRRAAGGLTGSSKCSAFSQWPNVKAGVKCNRCTALVLTDPYQGRCDKYCESFGHKCVGAAEEQSDNCAVKYSASCSKQISGTSDMLCACESSNGGNSQPGTSGPSQGSSNCPDSNGQCAAWARMGECTKNPQYMLANCKKSCNACSGTPSNAQGTTPTQCSDGNQQCSAWARNGECARNPAYMNVNCKRSCNRC